MQLVFLQGVLPRLRGYRPAEPGWAVRRNTHAHRVTRLLANGLPQAQMDRLHAPIGLDIGGRTPAEIALSLMAEIVAVRNKVTE